MSKKIDVDEILREIGMLRHIAIGAIRYAAKQGGSTKSLEEAIRTFPVGLHDESEDQLKHDVWRLLEAISKLGRDAKPDAVIDAARINRKRGRDILRDLANFGEYDGHARDKPARYTP